MTFYLKFLQSNPLQIEGTCTL